MHLDHSAERNRSGGEIVQTPPAEGVLAALQQQRNDQVLLVVEVAQKFPAEIDVGVAKPRELGVESGRRRCSPP